MYDLKPLVYSAIFFWPDAPTSCVPRENNVLDGLDRYHRKLHFQANIAIRQERIFMDITVIIVVEYMQFFRKAL